MKSKRRYEEMKSNEGFEIEIDSWQFVIAL